MPKTREGGVTIMWKKDLDSAVKIIHEVGKTIH